MYFCASVTGSRALTGAGLGGASTGAGFGFGATGGGLSGMSAFVSLEAAGGVDAGEGFVAPGASPAGVVASGCVMGFAVGLLCEGAESVGWPGVCAHDDEGFEDTA